MIYLCKNGFVGTETKLVKTETFSRVISAPIATSSEQAHLFALKLTELFYFLTEESRKSFDAEYGAVKVQHAKCGVMKGEKIFHAA